MNGRMIDKILRLPRLLGNCGKLHGAVRHQMAGRGSIGENRFHVRAGVGWLMRAQEKGGGGYSRRYCLYDGWDGPYTETTGYIIPTMIAAGKFLNDEKVIERAKTAAYWLLGMQLENGAFCDIDTAEEQVFDTGQVLAGLVAAFREWSDERFLEAAVRAGEWLVAEQEADGSWQRHAYNDMKHSYYVKVSAALFQLAGVTGVDLFYESAQKNIGWTLGCQEEDGYFNGMEFREGESPFLHTISYVLEGLMDSYGVAGDKSILDAALRTVSSMKKINRDREMLLCSQYGRNWAPVNKERCVSGLAQWAGIALRAYEVTADEDLLTQAVKTIYYLKSKQYLRPDDDLYGGLPGSVPIWGKYLGFCYPNWGVKYFIDLLLAYDTKMIPTWLEEEVWVSESFRFSDAVVADELGNKDRNYIKLMERALETAGTQIVLDVGCGKGKFIRYFREKYPHWSIVGIDPSFSGGGDIGTGSIYALPVPDGYADVIVLIEVMQHVGHIAAALTELSRVMKVGGILVIGDRDCFSITGALKPFMETAGLWMYPWDSPFREQWRSPRTWGKILGDDWQVIFTHSFDNPDNRVPLSNRFYLLTAQKKAS